jgi:hypothetical protein
VKQGKAMQPTLVILDHSGHEINHLALDPYDLRNPIETMALINEICAISHRQPGAIHLQLLSQGNASLELKYAIQTLNAALKALVKFDYSIRNSHASPNSCNALALNLSWIEELITLVTELTGSPAWLDREDCLQNTNQPDPALFGVVL